MDIFCETPTRTMIYLDSPNLVTGRVSGVVNLRDMTILKAKKSVLVSSIQYKDFQNKREYFPRKQVHMVLVAN